MSSLVDRFQRRLAKIEQSYEREPVVYIPGQGYAYVYGITPDSLQGVILGPFAVTDEAIEKHMAELDSAEKFILKTRDPGKAKKEIGAIITARSADYSDSLKKKLRNKGYEKYQQDRAKAKTLKAHEEEEDLWL